MGDRKEELLRAACGYLLQHGVADLSLRPLAEAIGTSARLLIFHFKSKERLLDEVLRSAHGRFSSMLSAQAATTPAKGSSTQLMEFWLQVTGPENLPYWRLLYGVHFIALQNRDAYAKYLKEASISWAKAIESRLPPKIRNAEMATLVGAVFDGLMMELLTSADLPRTTRALDDFIEMLRSASSDRCDTVHAKDGPQRRMTKSVARPAKSRRKRRA